MLTNTLNRIILFFLLTVLATGVGCNSINNNFTTNNEDTLSAEDITPPINESNKDYTISFLNSSAIKDFYLSDQFSINIIQIQNEKKALITKSIVNENIKNAMTSWISVKNIDYGEDLTAPEYIVLNIYCHSEKYLSFENALYYIDGKINIIRDYITIDMKTGERVMLNDLVEISEEFVKYIQSNSNVFSIGYLQEEDDETGVLKERYINTDTSKLLEYLEECSFTQEQVIENHDVSYPISSLSYRNSFYLENNTLVVVLHGQYRVTFNLDDIADFLKVEKW